jgi:hypothetical protein
MTSLLLGLLNACSVYNIINLEWVHWDVTHGKLNSTCIFVLKIHHSVIITAVNCFVSDQNTLRLIKVFALSNNGTKNFFFWWCWDLNLSPHTC